MDFPTLRKGSNEVTRPHLERAVSTWSLHRTLGEFAGGESAVDGGPFLRPPAARPRQSLLELLPDMAAHGYATLQICHFHLESRDPAYLDRMRVALAANEITLDMLLIDDGDLTAPDIDRQLAWYDTWLDAAEAVGARRARVCAGRQAPTRERLRASGAHLAALAARHSSVRVVTENWLEMTPDADSVCAVLDAAGSQVGLLIDLGNWRGPEKYVELKRIAPRAESCHAKCSFDGDEPDEADFRKTLAILEDAGFDGPLALIYDGPNPDEWAGLEREWQIVESVFG
jgi:sugar phosphate isomerase/epimerase